MPPRRRRATSEVPPAPSSPPPPANEEKPTKFHKFKAVTRSISAFLGTRVHFDIKMPMWVILIILAIGIFTHWIAYTVGMNAGWEKLKSQLYPEK